MKNSYTISEVANLFRMSSQTLRYYDKIGLLKPGGVQEHSNYRFYTQEEISRLYLIKELKSTGLPLTEIRRYCDNKEVALLETLLKENKKELDRRLRELNELKNNTEFYLKTIRRTKRTYQENVFEIRSLRERYAYTIWLNFSIDSLREEIEMLHSSYVHSCAGRLPREHGHAVLFIDKENLEKRHFKTYNGIGLLLERKSADKNTVLIRGGEYASASHIGRYETIGNTYRGLCRFIEKSGYEIAGASTEVSITNITFTDNPDEFITEIQIPVKKRLAE